VWLIWDRGPALLIILDVLRAFAHQRLGAFALRTLVRHPNGPPWAIAVPLVPWTMVLMLLSMRGRVGLLGFSGNALRAWIVFDAVLAWQLFRAARRPRVRTLAVLAVAAACDAVVSVQHLLTHGLGTGLTTGAIRIIGTAAPVLGSIALAWASHRAAARGPTLSSR
jgi:hypothetical protein